MVSPNQFLNLYDQFIETVDLFKKTTRINLRSQQLSLLNCRISLMGRRTSLLSRWICLTNHRVFVLKIKDIAPMLESFAFYLSITFFEQFNMASTIGINNVTKAKNKKKVWPSVLTLTWTILVFLAYCCSEIIAFRARLHEIWSELKPVWKL